MERNLDDVGDAWVLSAYISDGGHQCRRVNNEKLRMAFVESARQDW